MSEVIERLKTALADRYAIEREIGRGGMATVYLAEDLKHHRKVAIKVLHPELAAAVGTDRFLREIETVAGLTHPHVLPLHDSGEANGLLFYVMPYVEGESLRQRLDREKQLPVDQAIQIAQDVSDALDHAHRNGVVHRDIKPGNILLEEGHAVVTDFGVARAISEAGGEKITATGLAVGTPAYMSPEQASGEEADERSDIYALGCVLYEMLAGEPPLTGATPQSTAAKRLTDRPTPLGVMRSTVPERLQSLVEKTLAVSPADRPATARQLAEELAKVRRSPEPAARMSPAARWLLPVIGLAAIAVVAAVVWMLATDRSVTRQLKLLPAGTDDLGAYSIAVLPFENLGAPEDAYFAAGMTDEITSRLGAVSGLAVISRLSALRYAGTDKSTAEIGAELGVGYILGGSVRWAGGGLGRVRITPELVRVADNTQLWSEPYDRVIEDIFEVQSDIAGRVIEWLGVTLLERERTLLTARPTENLDAYTLYLKGRHFWNKRTEENIQIGLGYFQQAVELDPGYALAHVGIADTWIFRGWYSRLAPRETFPRAQQAVTKALEFDETLAEAHTSRAHIHLEFDYDWEAAEREYLRAIELNPRYPIAHHWYGGYLSAMGRHEEALRQAERARELDPLSLIINTWVGLRHYFAGRYDVAIAEYEKALELDPDFAPAHWHLGWALEKTGRYEEAISEAQRAIDISGGNPLYIASLGHAYAEAGRDQEARGILRRLEEESATRHVSAYHVAVIYGALGETDEAFLWLDRAYEERSPWIGYVREDPRTEGLRSDPRFDALLRKARLGS
ncbi:MAG: protein kinase [Gemmatimonadota bacterium]